MIHVNSKRTASCGYSARCYVVISAKHSSTRISDLLILYGATDRKFRPLKERNGKKKDNTTDLE